MTGSSRRPEVFLGDPASPVRALLASPPGAAVPAEREASGTASAVLVPGLGAVRSMTRLLDAVGALVPALLLDAPGFGRWRTARRPADLDSIGRQVTEALPGGRCVLVGHSTAAQVVARIAARLSAEDPGRLAGAVLVAPTFPPDLRRHPAGLVPAFVATAVHEPPWELPAVLPDYVRGGTGLLRLLADALRDRPEDAVAAVTCPVAVVRGRHDRCCPAAWAQALADAAPRGRLVTLSGAHTLPYTRPRQLARIVADVAEP